MNRRTLTRRGLATLALAAIAYLAAWAFGSDPLYPVALGLGIASALAWGSVALAAAPRALRYAFPAREHVEGDTVTVGVELRARRRALGGGLSVRHRITKLGERDAVLGRRSRGALSGSFTIARIPRGRYTFEDVSATLDDPFGLARAEVSLDPPPPLTVLPRLVELEGLFSESGGRLHEGRGMLLRRPTGFDLHSVRDYEQGESLRKVHWRSTAKRGQLMVKELEDSPRHEIAVVLDADARGVAGEPPDSSFDAAVRAAGSLLWAHVRRGRRSVLAINSVPDLAVRVHSQGDWRVALTALAAVEPSGERPVSRLLAEESGDVGRALDVTVVSSNVGPDLVDRLISRALARRRVALVYVDAASFRGRPMSSRPFLVRLAAAGCPVAVVRRGDDLAHVLSAQELQRSARA